MNFNGYERYAYVSFEKEDSISMVLNYATQHPIILNGKELLVQEALNKKQAQPFPTIPNEQPVLMPKDPLANI